MVACQKKGANSSWKKALLTETVDSDWPNTTTLPPLPAAPLMQVLHK